MAAQGTAGRGMRRDDRDADFVFASLDLVNLHPFGKREQRIAFHHDLVSLSTQSDEFFWRAVYHPFSLSHQPHLFPDSPKSGILAQSLNKFELEKALHSQIRTKKLVRICECILQNFHWKVRRRKLQAYQPVYQVAKGDLATIIWKHESRFSIKKPYTSSTFLRKPVTNEPQSRGEQCWRSSGEKNLIPLEKLVAQQKLFWRHGKLRKVCPI